MSKLLPAKILRAEGQVQHLPFPVQIGRQHLVGLAVLQRAHRGLDDGHALGGGRRLDQDGLARQRTVDGEQCAQLDMDVVGRRDAGRQLGAAAQMTAKLCDDFGRKLRSD